MLEETANRNLKEGVFFVSAVSNLYYRDFKSAGDISCIIVEGKKFYPKPNKE